MDETGLTIQRILNQNNVEIHYVLDGQGNYARGKCKIPKGKTGAEHMTEEAIGVEFYRTVDEITKKAQLLVRDLDPSVT